MSNKNVLIVDDDRDIVNIFKKRLENEGYKVLEASNRKEAIEKVKETRIHVALLDYVLSDIKGDRLALELKKIDDSIQIMLIKGYPEIQYRIFS